MLTVKTHLTDTNGKHEIIWGTAPTIDEAKTILDAKIRSMFPGADSIDHELIDNAEIVGSPDQQRAEPTRHNEPATEKQIAYLVAMRVQIEKGLTKREASQLIDAAKCGDLGSFGGRYTDGSF